MRRRILTLPVFLAALALHGAETAPGRTVPVNGIDIYYETRGSGPPLVLLHGFSASGQVWQPFLAAFGRQYRLIVPDLRGHGRSTNPSGEFTHRQSARDVYALLDSLNIRTFSAMGISTGGMTLLHMATQQPERVEAMVLIGATTYFPEQAREIMRKTTPDNIPPAQLERQRALHTHGDAQIRALRSQFNRFKDSYDDMTFTPPHLAAIRARTLIVHGDRDAFFPVSIPVEMYRSIPRSYLWIVPNGSHVPIQDHAREFERLALEFLSGKWARP
ncbi:MAG: alpha/beta hydrolase [Bryobacterales bacterium]|nr:alpha/beta hydrolase [Bryobacterales bacterium]